LLDPAISDDEKLTGKRARRSREKAV